MTTIGGVRNVRSCLIRIQYKGEMMSKIRQHAPNLLVIDEDVFGTVDGSVDLVCQGNKDTSDILSTICIFTLFAGTAMFVIGCGLYALAYSVKFIIDMF